MKSERFEHGDSLIKIILIYITLGIFCAISIYPALNILSISLRPSSTLFSTSLKIIPDNATFDNYINAFVKYDLVKWIINSLIISSLTAVFGVVLSVTAGYAFSRFDFWQENGA